MAPAIGAGIQTRGAARGRLRAVLLLCLAPGLAAAQEYTWQVESSITADTGKYGSDERTDLLYWPLSLKRFFSRGDATVTVPFLDLDTEGGQAVVDGNVVEGTGRGGSGPGDLLFKGRFNALEQDGARPFVDLFARLKLPTADEDKGLGTGEADLGFGAELAHRFAPGKIAFADFSYTFIGEPDGVDYDNRVGVELGLGHDFTPMLMGCVFYDYRSAISSGGEDAHSLSLFGNVKFSPRVRGYSMVDVGLSDGAADFGVTFGASYRFN